MKFSYNKLVGRVDTAIREQRRQRTLLGRLLPARVFAPALWQWEREAVATGVGWGVVCALAPLPLQSLFAIFACIWRRGNIPLGYLACWLSFPGYQVIAWPLQWWVGAAIMRSVNLGSGASIRLIGEAMGHFAQGYEAVLAPLHAISLPLLAVEFLLGCAITCAVAGMLARHLVLLCWKQR